MKILVADDDELFLKIVTEILEEAGHEVVPAKTGPKALELVTSERPDLAILDIILPGKSGTEVSERMRESSLTAPIPVLLVTSGSTEIEAEGSCVDCFLADDFMRKPFSGEKLLEKVELLSRKPSKFASHAGKDKPLKPVYSSLPRSDPDEITEDSIDPEDLLKKTSSRNDGERG